MSSPIDQRPFDTTSPGASDAPNVELPGARPASAPRPLVLLVEDHIDISEPLARLLERAGLRVWTQFSGANAMATLRMVRPDLVILDAMLPDVDGLEVLRAIRSRLGLDLPVIVYTAASDAWLQEQAAARGATEYFVKTVTDLPHLISRVQHHLSRMQAANQGWGGRSGKVR